MMKDIAIYGAGGLGKEVACLIKTLNEAKDGSEFNLIGFFDDNLSQGEAVSHYGTVLGNMNELNSWKSPLAVAVAVGNPSAVKAITSKIENPLVEFPNLIHPSLSLTDPETFTIGKGNIIKGQCEIAPDVKLGDFNCLIRDVVLGHDSTIGDFNVFMPNVYICGKTKVGNQNLFGIGSIVLQRLSVGNNVHVGAGSVLFTNPTDGCSYLGNPARKFLNRK